MGPAYFREAAEVMGAAGGPPDRAKMTDVFRRHGNDGGCAPACQVARGSYGFVPPQPPGCPLLFPGTPHWLKVQAHRKLSWIGCEAGSWFLLTPFEEEKSAPIKQNALLSDESSVPLHWELIAASHKPW